MGSLAATRSRSSMPIAFSTAEFTPNSARVVAASLCGASQEYEPASSFARDHAFVSAKGAVSCQPGASPQEFKWHINKRRKRVSIEPLDRTGSRNELRFQRWHLRVAASWDAAPGSS